MREPKEDRSIIISFEGMRHAPENELGVVFLFSKVARRLGFCEIDRIQPQFPDCWALRNTGRGCLRVWIEFEFRSSGFKSHLHQLRALRPRKGVVVCWEHDWWGCDRYAEVLELRTLLGFGRKVWVQNILPKYQALLDETHFRSANDFRWSVARSARPGDLVLMYRAGSRAEARKEGADEDLLQSIANVYQVVSVPTGDRVFGSMACVRQVALLKNPLRLEHLRRDPILSQAPFVRSVQGRKNVTMYWHRLYDLILQLNRDKETLKRLQQFAPERF